MVYVQGNTQILAGAEYNDLENHVYSAKLGFAGFTAIYRNHTYGDSGQLVSRMMVTVKVLYMLLDMIWVIYH